MSEQWTIKVRIAELDRGPVASKNRWLKGETISVQIEPHGTVGMLKQRIALLVAAHEKWQTLKLDGNVLEDCIGKLEDIEGMKNGAIVDLFAVAPSNMLDEDLGELSEDPDAIAMEDTPAPALPDDAGMERELTDDETDKQNALKQEATEAMEDGNMEAALAKMTEAVMVGNPSAMMLVKRGEMLLKAKRPNAAILDTTAALKKNPDSAKAYKVRGKAHRLLSMWEKAVEDFAQCQTIDYDDAVVDVHKYCTKRKVWHTKMAQKIKRDADRAEKEKKDAEMPAKK